MYGLALGNPSMTKGGDLIRDDNYEAQVRFRTQVLVQDSAIFEKGECGCGGTWRLKII